MTHGTSRSSAIFDSAADTAPAPGNSDTGQTTFTQTAADLMRELHQLQAVVQSSSVLDFEAELNAALGKEASPASANGQGRGPPAGMASRTHGATATDDDGDDMYEVVDDDGEAALASLNSDLETATRLLGLLDGKCDAMNARLDELLALMQEANGLGLGLDLDDSTAGGAAEPTVTVTESDTSAASVTTGAGEPSSVGEEEGSTEQDQPTSPSN